MTPSPTPTHALARVHPLPPALAKRMADADASLPAPAYTPRQAEDVLLGVFLADVTPDSIPVRQGRTKHASIQGFLREIEPRAIARAAEWMVAGACGERWGKIGGGQAYGALVWLGSAYPVLRQAFDTMQVMRSAARAERVLDRLDALAEGAENGGARVKAMELLLRAHHPAFGHATEAKRGTDRPLVVVNVASIIGSSGAESVSNAPTIDAEMA